MKPCVFLPGLLAFCSSLAPGQTSSPGPAFELAAIRNGAPFSMDLLRSGGIGMKINPPRVVIQSWALTDMIGAAFRVRADQIAGPDRMNGQRFDIEALMPERASASQVPEMLETLLRDRFKMVARRGEKLMPVYALTVAKGGPRLQESTPGDTTPSGCVGGGASGRVCHRMTMEDLCRMLTSLSRMSAGMPAGTMSWGIELPALDETGLKGTYDFTMMFGPGNPEDGGGSVVDALAKLGLKLESRNRPYEFVTVEQIEKAPSAN